MLSSLPSVAPSELLIRCVLGSRARELVLTHLDEVAFFPPRECFEDARRYLPDLLSKRSVVIRVSQAKRFGIDLTDSLDEAWREMLASA